ncbi:MULTISPECIES: rRNA maturation RNase YbeY [Succinivibrio]|jgi:probable rRNA maturation factor|uniref:Endoribonuclease YbeY n=1 Tax=Succinivibrio dextrinosolvens TaxID=83771 RepID=A0A662ZAM9_9GAMM|nr:MULTISPECIES: rRNA maturation RNase YbeY [Succinivibrio]MBQ3884467.1 rRNA maturation RNase YbeY [Succinivibrio sp.]MBQ9219835.1 rRNA maturation RNase YbeY [Succinivibrio sp.]MDY6416829.1 rRNA maturation RNase YbeY [Succinivibrio dextrinosolvens]SFJ85201.1 probable rRNA maturation factor [Succinivibrio dextrinosolvens]
MQVIIDLQIATDEALESYPSLELMTKWATVALKTGGRNKDSEITIRMVNSEEIHQLNSTYRHVDRPTNILSFPFELPEGVEDLPLLGDLVVCKEVLERECKEQNKTLEEHFAHLIVHGCLHLIGYDHIEEEDAKEMEPLEIKAMEELGYDNPYKDDEY